MRIGLLGGTFDPPHIGHLAMAEEARVRAELDEVWFLPTYLPPHKERRVTEAKHRIEMVRLAISTNEHFKLSLIEQERKGKSYTIETIQELKNLYPDCSFYFILGGDMVEDLPNWYRIEDLKQMVSFIGVTRTGYQLMNELGVDLQTLEIPSIDISSTLIRERINREGPFRYFLTEKVRNYIEERHLYEQ